MFAQFFYQATVLIFASQWKEEKKKNIYKKNTVLKLHATEEQKLLEDWGVGEKDNFSFPCVLLLKKKIII